MDEQDKSAKKPKSDTKAALLAERLTVHKELKASKLARLRSQHAAFELPDMPGEVGRLMRRPSGLKLDEYAHRLTSQHGEDGVTVEVFRRVGTEHRRAVELGCGVNGGNAGVLTAGLGWETLLVDGDPDLLVHARRIFSSSPATIVQAWIAAETINTLLGEHGFDRDVDYLGIDLDGIDYWILSVLTIRPRLIVVEFNPFFGPDVAVTVPYQPDFDRTKRVDMRHVLPKGYFGASINAFERLARSKDYRLIGAAPRSSNAYFLRDDLDGGLPTISAADAWRPIVKGKQNVPVKTRLMQQINDEGVAEYFERRGFPLVEVPEPIG
jgi:hypothetical protein